MARILEYNQVVLRLTDDVGNVSVIPWCHILSVGIAANMPGALSTIAQADGEAFHVSREDAITIANLLEEVLKGYPVGLAGDTDYDSEG